MSLTSYTYCVVHYTHDPGAGESLNIGVVLYSPGAKYLDARFQQKYERLSGTFSGFNGDHYKRSIRRYEAAIDRMREEWTSGIFVASARPKDLSTIIATLWPDPELSYACGPILVGVTDDADDALRDVFDRMITSQYDADVSERRTDQQVWSVYNKSFIRQSITHYLEPKSFTTEAFDVKFDHAFKNGSWHALKAISLDYSKPEGMKSKVTKLLGDTVALEDNTELGMLYLLLGPPKSADHLPAYRKAKALLQKRIKVEHQIIEENQAERFADDLAKYMREHGVIKTPA